MHISMWVSVIYHRSVSVLLKVVTGFKKTFLFVGRIFFERKLDAFLFVI